MIADELRRALGDRSGLRELDAATFLRAGELYEGLSDQRSLLHRWFDEELAPGVHEADLLSVLTVGCGSGENDAVLLRALQRRAGSIELWAVEPGEAALASFEARIRPLLREHDRLHLRCSTLERAALHTDFDIALLSHCLYYLADPLGAISQITERIRPSGQVVVVHAPFGLLNQLAAPFWQRSSGHAVVFAEELFAALSRLGTPWRRHVLPGRLDVSSALDELPEGRDLLSFLLQVDLASVRPDLVARVRDHLRAHASDAPESAGFVPHPAWCLTARL